MIDNSNGTLFIVAAPSGGGKTSLVAQLVADMSQIEVSISHTTRPKREAEQDGVNYFFIDDASFQQMVEDEQFIEYAKVFDYHYGTSIGQLESKLSSGIDVLLDIDWQGAKQLKQRFTQVVSIFIIPPSLEELRQRLTRRGQDDERIIESRMQKAQSEIEHYDEFDYLIINDDFEQALVELKSIIVAERLKMHKQSRIHAKLLSFLLGKR